jgi:hypothetical protein
VFWHPTFSDSIPLPHEFVCATDWLLDLVAKALSVVVSAVAATNITASAATTATYFEFISDEYTNDLFICIEQVQTLT